MPDFFNFLQDSLVAQSAAGLFLVFFFGTFISEDAACLLAGSAVANGRISFGLAVLACLAGIFAGDVALYGLGRLVGVKIFSNRIVSKFVSRVTRDKAAGWLQRNAASAVFLSRFTSGLRLPTYLMAGALRANFLKFTLLFLIASAIWTPILVGSIAFAQGFIFRGSTIFGIVAMAIAVSAVLKLASWKNRRLFIGRVKRVANWEFWPWYIFYLPVVCYVFLLAVRFRSLTVLTAANPGIPAGGFVGESKDWIYRLIGRSPAAKPHQLRYVKINTTRSLTQRLFSSIRFLQQNDLTFPLVLKPDIGERGNGVQIIHDKKQTGVALKSADRDLILQEFYTGVEASVFYYRLPDKDLGHIFSITEKVFPFVVGDGESTIEQLILRDRRAVCMAKKYFDRLADQLDGVPAKGETVQLIDIGTHSRGAIFRDGEWLRTPELESRIDEICRGIEGFYFGRFDIRAKSFEDLRAGNNFKIIELNGVTSESTNIYDPKYSLSNAYRILFAQWKLAFEIGAENKKRGAKPVSFRELLKIIFTRKAEALEQPSETRSKTSTLAECA